MRTAIIDSSPMSAPPGSPARMARLPSETMIPINAGSRPHILGGVPPTPVSILKPLPSVPGNAINVGSEFINSNTDFSNGNLNGMESIDDIRISSTIFFFFNLLF